MKRCPTCGSSYTDDTLIFCLQDGAALQSPQDASAPLSLVATLRGDSQGGEQPSQSQDPQSIKAYSAPTVELPASSMQTALYQDARATAPVLSGGGGSSGTAPGSSPQARPNTTRIIAITVGITVLVLALGGIAAWMLFRGQGDGRGRERRAAQSNTGGGAANNSGNDGYGASNGSNSAQSNNQERGDKGGRWFVILGSFPKDEIDRATERMDNLRRQGLDARVVSSDDYPNFKSGLWLVVMGPFTRNQAEDVLSQAKPKVKDAYTKAGW